MMMKTYIIALIKLIIILVIVPLVGNFTIVKLFNLNIDWIYELLLFLSCIYAMDAIPQTFSKPYTWEKLTNFRAKIQVIISIVILLSCSFFPSSQGSNQPWLNLIFFYWEA